MWERAQRRYLFS